MKLLDAFCTVDAFVVEGTVIRAQLRFPESDPVYGGHFPGRPVVPGACILEVVKELAEHGLDGKLRLTRVGNMKFPAALLPSDTELVTIEINYVHHGNSWNATATVKSGDRLNVSLRDLAFESIEA